MLDGGWCVPSFHNVLLLRGLLVRANVGDGSVASSDYWVARGCWASFRYLG